MEKEKAGRWAGFSFLEILEIWKFGNLESWAVSQKLLFGRLITKIRPRGVFLQLIGLENSAGNYDRTSRAITWSRPICSVESVDIYNSAWVHGIIVTIANACVDVRRPISLLNA